MKKLIQVEEALLFTVCVYVFPYMGVSWWWFAAFILLPDIGMAGYLANPRTGAYTYNLFHHRGLALVIGMAGYFTGIFALTFAGYILFTHACMDRIFGYGLKYEKGFKYTHLGVIGNAPE